MGESTSRHLEVPTFIPNVLQTFVPLSLTSALLLCFKSALPVTFLHGDLWNFRSLLIMAGGRRMDAGRRSREGPSKEPDFLPSLPDGANVEANLRGPVGLNKCASIFENVWFNSAPSE
nr:hypothetical protein [Tanacetum cinerariifolium]